MIDSKFISSKGLVMPNLWDRGENGILFRAYLDWLSHLNGDKNKYLGRYSAITNTYDVPHHTFMANPPESTDHFSIDNMLGLYAMVKLHAPRTMLTDLPIMYWNDEWNLHPNSWMVFLCIKYPILKLLFGPFIFTMAWWSSRRPHSDTTGRLLWWLRLTCLGMKRTLKVLEKNTKKRLPDGGAHTIHEDWQGLKYSFHYYFTHGWDWAIDNLDHPVIVEAEKYFKP